MLLKQLKSLPLFLDLLNLVISRLKRINTVICPLNTDIFNRSDIALINACTIMYKHKITSSGSPQVSLSISRVAISEFERTFPSVVCVSSTSIFNSSSTASLCAVNTKSGFCGLVAVKCFCGSSAFSFGDCSVFCFTGS